MNSWLEAANLLKGHGCSCPSKGHDDDDHKEKHNKDNAYMFKQNLAHIIEGAAELYTVLDDEHEIPKWAEAKAAVTADKVGTLNRYLKYKAQQGHLSKSFSSWFEVTSPPQLWFPK
jgi:hypothetical protein